MFMNILLTADCNIITTCQEHLINENLMRQNAKRRKIDYAINQKVLKKLHDLKKLGIRTSGPFLIKRVHVNGTLTTEL